MASFFNNVGPTGVNTAGVTKNNTGSVIEFKRLKAGANITIVEAENVITIGVNTAQPASTIINNSLVSGANVALALNELSASLSASLIDNDSVATGATVTEALNVMSLEFTAVKTADYSASFSEFVPIDLVAAASGVTCGLPNITALNAQRKIGVKMATWASGSSIEVRASGSQVVDGLDAIKLTSGHESVIMQADGISTWYRIG